MQDLNKQHIAAQQRRGGVTMIKSEPSVVGLDISFPDLFPLHCETRELAITGHDPDVLAVGNWRGRRRVLLAEELISTVDLLSPDHRAIFAIDRDKKDLVSRLLTGRAQFRSVKRYES